MRARFFFLSMLGFGLAASAGAAAAGCGPSVQVTATGGGGGSGGQGGEIATTATSSSGHAEGGVDALPDYVDPGCPDAGPALQAFDCDPYNQNNGDCFPGEGCFIFVQYPEEPCGQEIYGSVCAPAGFGVQGDPCGNGNDTCAGGFVCVVSGSGNQCVQLCPLAGASACPPGLVCEPIDVEGFGGCL